MALPGGEAQAVAMRDELFDSYLPTYAGDDFLGIQNYNRKRVRPDGETVLTDPVVDRAALHGILSKIRDLGVSLLSIRRLAADETHTERTVQNGNAGQ